MSKPLVYIAGPFTKGDQISNCRTAMLAWNRLRESELITPICPHWSAYQQLLTPLTWGEWIKYDLELITHCDAVYRMFGESKGADAEVEFASGRSIPVFYNEHDLLKWASAWEGK